jgi:hypothetical protein
MLVAGGVILLVLGLFAVSPAAASHEGEDGGSIDPDRPGVGDCEDDSVDLLDPEPYEPDYGTDDPGVGVDRDAACPSPDLGVGDEDEASFGSGEPAASDEPDLRTYAFEVVVPDREKLRSRLGRGVCWDMDDAGLIHLSENSEAYAEYLTDEYPWLTDYDVTEEEIASSIRNHAAGHATHEATGLRWDGHLDYVGCVYQKEPVAGPFQP